MTNGMTRRPPVYRYCIGTDLTEVIDAKSTTLAGAVREAEIAAFAESARHYADRGGMNGAVMWYVHDVDPAYPHHTLGVVRAGSEIAEPKFKAGATSEFKAKHSRDEGGKFTEGGGSE